MFLIHNVEDLLYLFIAYNLLGIGGSIDCWLVVHYDRETQIIFTNGDGIFFMHQPYTNTTSIPFVSFVWF